MPSWKDLLATAGTKQTLQRAKQCLAKKTIYVLGTGGINPLKPFTEKCDCSGFVAWAIGIPRELPPGSDHWLQTDTYWAGDDGRFDEVGSGNAHAGDIYVYPDQNKRQGHMGIITQVDAAGVPTRVIHCSKGSYTQHGDAVRETVVDIFKNHPLIRIVRPDYAKLQADFGVAVAPENVSDEEDPPLAEIVLEHPLLAADAGMREVAAGRLVLLPDGHLSATARVIHEAFLLLAVATPAYAIDLGVNDREKGYYGKKTGKVMRAFQKAQKLPATGEFNRLTVAALDAALLVDPAGKALAEGTGSTVLVVNAGGGTPGTFASAAAAVDNRQQVGTLHKIVYLPGKKKKKVPVPIYELPGRSGYFYLSRMAVDVDGAPRAYHKNNAKALDYLANGGEPGNWWALVTDNGKKTGNPVVQGPDDPAPGYYISQTSLRKGPEADPGSYVDSEAIPYIVFPGDFMDVSAGDCGIIASLKTGKITHALFADTNANVGEASYKAAVTLGVQNPSPKNGGDESDSYVYLIFPGSKFVPELNSPHWPDAKIKQVAEEHFAAWGGIPQLKACFPGLA